ncbi:MAG: hypothetical protein CMH56_17055 [Myxococcales bacterium]|nr:hypothetical protein [Myxococcales bacterium]
MSKFYHRLLPAGVFFACLFAAHGVQAQGQITATPPPGLDIPQDRWVKYAEDATEEMQASYNKGIELLAAARQSRDAVQMNCVNEKVTAMKGILRVAQDAKSNLKNAMAINDIEQAKEELKKIRMGRSKLQEALTGANTCSGAEASYTGGTQVELEVDPVSANPASQVKYEADASGNVSAVQTRGAGAERAPGSSASGDGERGAEGADDSAGGGATLQGGTGSGGIAGSTTAGSGGGDSAQQGGTSGSSDPGGLNNVNQAGAVSLN